MPTYRMSYPCSLFISVQADDEGEARKKAAEILEPVVDGIDLVHFAAFENEARLYGDCNTPTGYLNLRKLEIENIEEDSSCPPHSS